MILLLDIGNTRVKWAWLEEFTLGESNAAAHDSTHRSWQREIEDDGRVPHRIVLANVAGADLRQVVVDWAVEHFGVEPDVLTAPAEGCGVRNAYLRPERLGIDRWLGLVAARRASPRPACILAAGTAFAIDALDGDGRHLGGFILPGLALLAESLAAHHEATGAPVAGFDALAGTAPAAEPGPVLLAAAAERSIEYLAERSGAPPRVVLTGGDAGAIAPLLAPRLSTPVEIVPDLVMTGLALVATARCG